MSHDPEIPLLGIHTKQLKTGIQINIYTCVHSSTVFNRQIMETAQIPVNGWMGTFILPTFHKILLSHKKEISIDTCHNAEEPWKWF